VLLLSEVFPPSFEDYVKSFKPLIGLLNFKGIVRSVIIYSCHFKPG